MIARAWVALGGRALSPADIAAGRLYDCERAEYTGEGSSWQNAKAAAAVPNDAQVLYWLSDD